VVCEAGQKDKLGYQALISQIEAGLAKGYSDKEVVSAVVLYSTYSQVYNWEVI